VPPTSCKPLATLLSPAAVAQSFKPYVPSCSLRVYRVSATDDKMQVIGRKDASGAAPEGTLPQAFGKGSDHATLVQLWADKGFSQRELAALMGAHSVSRAFKQQANGIPTGGELACTSYSCTFSKTNADNLSRTTRQHSYEMGHKVLLADPSDDCAPWRLPFHRRCQPRQPQHHVRRSIHGVCQ
jgi:hypothetical protein